MTNNNLIEDLNSNSNEKLELDFKMHDQDTLFFDKDDFFQNETKEIIMLELKDNEQEIYNELNDNKKVNEINLIYGDELSDFIKDNVKVNDGKLKIFGLEVIFLHKDGNYDEENSIWNLIVSPTSENAKQYGSNHGCSQIEIQNLKTQEFYSLLKDFNETKNQNLIKMSDLIDFLNEHNIPNNNDYYKI